MIYRDEGNLATLNDDVAKSSAIEGEFLAPVQVGSSIANLTQINLCQQTELNRLRAGIHGKLTTSKTAKLAKCSGDTAFRGLRAMFTAGIIRQNPGGGISTH